MTDPTPPVPPPPALPPPGTTRVEPPDRRPRPRRPWMGCLIPLVLAVLFVSLLANVFLGYFAARNVTLSFDDDESLDEKFYLGDRDASDKVAVIRIEGVITDGTSEYPIKQLERAAKDRRVKAVVLRVDSPGGTVTASEELYRCAVDLRDNTGRRFAGSGPKPVSVSMGALAASGGYYVAMAGQPVAAEPTTITGSIGVFAALPNVSELAHNNGVRVELVKAGEIKGSGSFFHEMSPEERQTWQDTVDHAYDIFLTRVAAGRPGLTKERIRDEVVINREIPVRDEKGNPKTENGKVLTATYTRKRADGGTFTAEQAREFGLVDRVEDLPAVIRAAAAAAQLDKFKAVVYDQPASLLDLLTRGRMQVRTELPDVRSLSAVLTPRLWYLAPTTDGAILTPKP